MAFNIERLPNQAGKPAVLLRQASRIRKKTIANLFMLSDHVVEGFAPCSRAVSPSATSAIW